MSGERDGVAAALALRPEPFHPTLVVATDAGMADRRRPLLDRVARELLPVGVESGRRPRPVRTWRAPAFYDDERQNLGPHDLLDETDAQQALRSLEFVAERCERLLAESA